MIKALHTKFLESTGVTIDSRTVKPEQIFFAIKGEHFDGNQYAEIALESGAKYVVVSDLPKPLPAGKYLLVDDTLLTLQELAHHHRKVCGKPVIALTGSNGKTTTKELLRAVLQKKYRTFATFGNLNNHLGVPLSLLSIQNSHEIAVIEMGANHQKEIAELCKIAEPTAGLITNIGKAHLEGFGGEIGVLKGKTELFDHLNLTHGTIFWNAGDQKLQTVGDRFKFQQTYGSPNADIFAQVVTEVPTLVLAWQGMTIKTNLTGAYNADNIMAAICVGKYYSVPDQAIVDAIEGYIPNNSRSQIEQIGQYQVILDAYNANPSSLWHALENLAKLDSHGYFIIGDMFELGDASAEEHQAIINLSEKLNLSGIFIGHHFANCKSHKNATLFKEKEMAAAFIKTKPPKCEYILLKGSRGMRMESLVETIKALNP